MTDEPNGHENNARQTAQPRKSSRLKLFLWIAGGACLLFGLLLVLTPHVIRWGLERALAEKGAVHARIEDVDFNPFEGKLVIKAFRGYPGQEREKLAVAHAQVEISWLPLWNRRIFLTDLALQDVTLDLTRHADGSWTIGELNLPAPAQEEPSASPEEAPKSDWQFGIGRILLENVLLRYQDPQLKTSAKVEKFHVGSLETWAPDQQTPFDLAMTLESGRIELSGQARPLAQDASGEARIKINELPLGWLEPALTPQQITGLSGRVNADLAFSGAREKSARTMEIDASGQLGLSGLDFQHPQLTLGQSDIHWSGEAQVADLFGQPSPGWEIKGQLDLAAAQLSWQKAEELSLTVAIEGQSHIEGSGNPQQGLRLRAEGPLKVSGADLEGFGLTLADSGVAWDGTTLLSIPPEAQPLQVEAEGTVNLTRLDLILKQAALGIQQEALAADLNLDFSAGDEAALKGEASLSAEDLRVRDLEREREILILGHLEARQVVLQGVDDLSAEAIILKNIQALERPGETSQGSPPFILAAEEIGLISPNLQGLNQMTAKTLEVRAIDAWLLRNPEGTLETAQWTAPPEGKEAKKAPNEGREAPPESGKNESTFAIALDQLQLTGNNRLTFIDNSISPSFKRKISQVELVAQNLDNRDPNQKSPIEASGRVGDHGQFDIKGTLQPFAEQLSSELEITLSNIDMAPIDGYLRQATGYRLKSGRLAGEVQGKIDDNNLDSRFDLVLKKFQVEALSQKEKSEVTGDLGVPLGKALDMLRNSDGDIALDIPVQGDLADPQFKFNKVIMSAFLKAIKSGVVSYYAPIGVTMLTGVSLPVGALWAAGKLYDMATAIRFDPMIFPDGSAELNAEQNDRLDKMAGLLKDRPEVTLVICGIAVPSDLATLRARQDEEKKAPAPQDSPPAQEPAAPPAPTDQEKQNLYNLATQRAKAVQNALLERKIPAERLTTCSPDYQWQEEAQPRVELGI